MQFPTEADPNAKPGQRGHMSAYVSPFGKPEGIAARLRDHMKKLGTDKTLPWVGLGLIDDLACAASLLDGQPSPLPLPTARAEVFAQLAGEARDQVKRPAPVVAELEDWEKAVAPAPAQEFDL